MITIRQIGAVVLLVVLALTIGHAQKRQKKFEKETFKLDEFGSVGHCDLTARLDNFAIFLQTDPTATGHVVYYGPDDADPEGGALANVTDYLVNSRGIMEDRIIRIHRGANDDLKQPRIQLWVVPAGHVLPELPKYKNSLSTFTGMFDEHEAWDTVAWGEPQMGPGIGNTTYRSFEQMLLQRKDTFGYIVGFNGKDAAPGAWQRVATEDFQDLTKAGIQPTRLRIVYGGSAKETKVQWWITPTNVPPPVKSAGEEPLPEKTVLLGSFLDAQLAETKSERWALNSLLEQLQRDKSLRACLVVQLESDKEEEVEEEAGKEKTSTAETTPPASIATSVDPEYTEPEDDSAERKTLVLKLVEKWKTELTTTHKIAADRVVVLFAEVPKYYQNRIDTWIVPQGQPLPDPKADTDSEPEEEESTKATVNSEKPRQP